MADVSVPWSDGEKKTAMVAAGLAALGILGFAMSKTKGGRRRFRSFRRRAGAAFGRARFAMRSMRNGWRNRRSYRWFKRQSRAAGRPF